MRKMVRAALAVLALACAPVATAQDFAAPPSATGDTPEVQLEKIITYSRHTAKIENGRLTGEGGDFLRALGVQSRFVMLGEAHGNSGIATFADAYWRDLNDIGFNYAAVESDPWTTAALERELRAGGVEGWNKFVSTRGGAAAAPFFTWAPEADLAADVLTRAKGRAPVLWGLDQVFIGAAPWLIKEVSEKAHDPQARALAAPLAASAAGNLNWLPLVDPAALGVVRAHLNDRRDVDYAALLDAMIVSQDIYRPFTGGGGESYFANTTRENLMRELFTDNYSNAERADGHPPRVMLKMGASHAQRGASPLTQIQGFGGFLSEFALAHDSSALTVLTLCGPGGEQASFQGPPEPCMNDEYNKNWAFLTPHLDPASVTIFDLRPWRLRPRRWASLPADVQRLIVSFDVLVFAPSMPASQFLPGLPPPVIPH